jgi:hypothetical protein
MSYEVLDSDLVEFEFRQIFAKKMMLKFKHKNIAEGINAIQSLWLHERTRKWQCEIMGVTLTVDIINMAVSGDIETACLALIYGQPDDMTHPKHWFTQERMNFLINEMKEYLGWE